MIQKLFFRNFLIFSAINPDDLFTGSLLVENGKITKIYRMQGTPPPKDSRIIEGHGRLLMPGLVNSHTHIYSAFARGMSISPFSPNSFRELLEQLWWRLDKGLNLKDIYYSGIISAMDMIRNGVTTFIDHHASPNAVEGSLEQLVRGCVEELGLRGIFCYETSDRDGREIAEKGIKENLSAQEFSQQYPERAASLFGLHASFTLSDETLKKCAEYDIPVHVHVAEGEEDASMHEEQFGMSAISRLNSFGLLREKSLLAHCLLIEDADLQTIRDKKCCVVFNPQSNMNNGAGLPDYSKFAKNGININLGNDGYGFDLTRDMRTLLLSQHLLKKDPTSFSTTDLFKVAFHNNTKYASDILKTKIGRIAEGYAADLIIYDYDPPTPLNASNFIDHYYFSIMENCKPVDVFVAGNHLLKSGKLSMADEKKLTIESQKQCEDFWSRV